jgi:hypothetical protein
LAKHLLVQGGARVVLGQHALELGVGLLDGHHGVIHEPADGGQLRGALELVPPGLFRDPKHVPTGVLVLVLQEGIEGLAAVLAGLDVVLRLGVLGGALQEAPAVREGVVDVLQENEAEHHVLVLGRVHVPAQGVCGGPELRLEP